MKMLLFQVEIGGQECLAVRISYTGELGWEIYMPRDKMKPVYNTLMEKGKKWMWNGVIVHLAAKCCEIICLAK